MRAVHVLRKLNPVEWGGTETAIERLCSGLSQQGVDTVAYCPRLEHAPAGDPLSHSGCKVKRFRAFMPVTGISRQRRRQLVSVGGNLMSFDLASSLWREKEAAIIHAHVLGRIGGIARIVARRRRIPFVVSIHGGVLDLPTNVRREFNAPRGVGWEWGKIFGWIVGSRHLFRDADAIITCNEKEAALLRSSHPDKRIVVQPHGVPVDLYEKNHRQTALEAFPKIRGRQMLLCVGRIDPIKNQAWLLDQAQAIFQRHPRVMLVLAGACTDEPYGELIARKIESLGLGDRILMTGGLPPNDPRLIGLLQEAAAVVLPSVSETFGLVALEAWAAGTVVLSSRTSGPSALLRHGENGWLFALEEPRSFHQTLDLALSDVALARRMAGRGALVSQQHGLGVLAARLKKLYEQLIEEKRCAT
ncbi:MAG TPA: glycosyltransferase family 4 protein [Candidatus Baltobacteraceae bacterium]|jgi:glycosyltransferase involved in cell wall biosynthesis|nr:glycosyltransferase family 4 protein [Candidatus Baltobacteraceae bacterium]